MIAEKILSEIKQKKLTQKGIVSKLNESGVKCTTAQLNRFLKGKIAINSRVVNAIFEQLEIKL